MGIEDVDKLDKESPMMDAVEDASKTVAPPGLDPSSGPTPGGDGGGDEKEEKEEKEEKKADTPKPKPEAKKDDGPEASGQHSTGGIEDIMNFKDIPEDQSMFDGAASGFDYLKSKFSGGSEPSMSAMDDTPTPGGDSPAASQESSKSEGFEAQLKGMVNDLADNEMVVQAASAASMSQGGPPIDKDMAKAGASAFTKSF